MAVRNLMEDIVSSIIKEVKKKDKESVKKSEFDDILAYVLNRTCQRYVTGERGVLHGKINARYAMQERPDILFLIYEAIDVISKRRSSNIMVKGEKGAVSDVRCRHILGQVLEESTFSIIPDVKVKLLFDGKGVEMADKSFSNPYITNGATKGYYHFWARYNSHMENNKFKLDFKHPKFEKKTLDIDIDSFNGFDISRSFIVPVVLLKLKEGSDLDFIKK